MNARGALLALATLGLGAQEYFKEAPRDPWTPAWELWVSSERTDLVDPAPDFSRTRGRLRLRWTFGEASDTLRLLVGTASNLGSDGNRDNLRWFDNEPSNGSRMDLAALRIQGLGERVGAQVDAGLVENPLIASESLWDGDLRVLGGSGSAYWRGGEGEGLQVEEVGLRGVGGKVRLMDGGRVNLRAGQAVVKASGAGIELTVHGGIWDLEARQEDAPSFRRQNPPGPGGYLDPHFRFEVYGAAISLPFALPVEVKALRHLNRDTRDRGEEFQAWVGSPARVWWPRIGYIRQRLDDTGALASVNGDLWWFHAGADGQRYVAALNLPRQWRLELSRVEQTRRGAEYPVVRSGVSLIKRF